MGRFGGFKDPDEEVRSLARYTENARVRESARLRAEHGYELPEDDRFLAGDTDRQRDGDRRVLEAAGILDAIEAHAKEAVTARSSEWDEFRWAAGSSVGR